MASKIRVLDDHTINKIAAGEVIENPASVVKELIENSIDAGAKEICIEIKGGGRQLIRISDDGCGMNSDDALLCLERHATSKIRDADELHTLSTMGFRGEAIPSIASISKFTLITCSANKEAPDASIGTMVIVDGGKIVTCAPAARSQGTTIEVKSLFFNIPVRKKFLKSPVYDGIEILKIVSIIALGHPEIKFQFINDGKCTLMAPESLESSSMEKLKARVATILGEDFLQNCSQIANKSDKIEFEGFIGNPSYTRHNRTGQYLFINRRPVVAPLIYYALKEGFGTAIAHGRHPVFVLHLVIPGELIDINVHPQKREVRLRQESIIKELLVASIQKTLSLSTNTFISPSRHHSYDHTSSISPAFAEILKRPESAEESSLIESSWVFKPKSNAPQASSFPSLPHPLHLAQKNPENTTIPDSYPTSRPNSEATCPPPKVLSTIPGYILLDGSIPSPSANLSGGIFFIDQKLAHARIIFEKLINAESGIPPIQQTLLIPYQFEVSAHEAEVLRGSLELFKQMGIQIQEFGLKTFIIDAIPQIFGNSDLQRLLSDILSDLRLEDTQENTFQKEKTKKIAFAASRNAISSNKKLSMNEAQSLIEQLYVCKQPFQCPNGRNILFHLSPEILSRQFQK